MCKKVLVVFFMCLVTSFGFVQAESQIEPQKKTSAIKTLVKMTQSIKSYQANFHQKITDNFGNVKDESKGIFLLEKPFQFVWQTQSPFEQNILSDGTDLWTHDIDLDQVNVQTLNKAMGNTPVLLLAINEEKLGKTFTVEELVSGSPDANTFELKPIDSGYAFERMMVLFKKNVLKEILLTDSLGQKTIVTFTDAKVNADIGIEKFTFVMPEDVDVIDSREKSSKPSVNPPSSQP